MLGVFHWQCIPTHLFLSSWPAPWGHGSTTRLCARHGNFGAGAVCLEAVLHKRRLLQSHTADSSSCCRCGMLAEGTPQCHAVVQSHCRVCHAMSSDYCHMRCLSLHFMGGPGQSAQLGTDECKGSVRTPY